MPLMTSNRPGLTHENADPEPRSDSGKSLALATAHRPCEFSITGAFVGPLAMPHNSKYTLTGSRAFIGRSD